MDSVKKLLTILVAICVVLVFTLPSYAADPPSAKQELKKITPQRYRYMFSVLGGAALGAGIGAILGSGNDLTKGALIGGGGMSALYLTSFPNAGDGYRSWAFLLSNTALGAGVGWTLCGCNNGLVAGTLVGGGGTAAWRAWHAEKRTSTATANPRP